MTATLHQVAVPGADLARSTAFYRDLLGLEMLADFSQHGLVFFRLGETRLLVEQSNSSNPGEGVLYLRVDDIADAHARLGERGMVFDAAPHLIHRDEVGHFGPPGSEEWMAFFRDPDGNRLALASTVVRR